WTIRMVNSGGTKRCSTTPPIGIRARISSRVSSGRRLRVFARVMPSSCRAQASAQARLQRDRARLTVFVGPGDAGRTRAHGQGADGRALVFLAEGQPLPRRIGPPDPTVVQTRGQPPMLFGG